MYLFFCLFMEKKCEKNVVDILFLQYFGLFFEKFCRKYIVFMAFLWLFLLVFAKKSTFF